MKKWVTTIGAIQVFVCLGTPSLTYLSLDGKDYPISANFFGFMAHPHSIYAVIIMLRKELM